MLSRAQRRGLPRESAADTLLLAAFLTNNFEATLSPSPQSQRSQSS